MRSPILFIFLFSTVLVLAIAHLSAVEFSFYWKYWWFDLLTHMLGGMSVAFGVLLVPSFIQSIPKKYFGFVQVVTMVLIVGILWELFEVVTGIMIIESGYWIDTLSDLSMDLIGATIGYCVGNQVRFL